MLTGILASAPRDEKGRIVLPEVNFQEAVFSFPPHFSEVVFTGNPNFTGTEFPYGAVFSQAFFEKYLRLFSIKCAGKMDFSSARFASGGRITLQGSTAEITLDRAVFSPFLTLSGIPDQDGGLPKILSFSHTQTEKLRLERLDFSQCVFPNMHRLEELNLDSESHFPWRRVSFLGGKRRVIAEEEIFRGQSNTLSPLSPSKLEDIYRALKNTQSPTSSAAQEFAFSEMEMARLGKQRGFSFLLLLFKIFSGYGYFPARAIIWISMFFILVTCCFYTYGFSPASVTSYNAVNATLDAILFWTSPDPYTLTTFGEWLFVITRIMGWSLLFLTGFSLYKVFGRH